MKWSVRGACAALSSCLLLACALSAAAVGLKCFSLGSELKGEPFRLGTAAGAFYSGLLLATGLSLLGSALFCCRQTDDNPGNSSAAAAANEGAGGAHPRGHAGSEVVAVPVSGDSQGPAPPPKAPANGRQNFLLLGALVFMLGVLSAFAGAVIDGDTVSLVEKKYSHYCLLQAGGGTAGAAPARTRSAGGPDGSSAAALRCQKLRDYQRGLVISTIFNALECLLGLLNLLLVKNYKAAQQRGLRRRRQRRRHDHHGAGGRRRRRRGPGGGGGGGGGGGLSGGGRRPQRPSQGSIFSSEDPEVSPGGDCAFQAVSYINVGVFHVFDEAGVEVHCGGHPSIELPGYSPMDPDLHVSYPYCYPLPNEQPPAYDDIYPREPCANRI